MASTDGLRALAGVVINDANEKAPSLENVRTVAALLLEMSFLPSVHVRRPMEWMYLYQNLMFVASAYLIMY